jgi:N-methylhydantoinase B/oxoprolinase/acetone carboxylase alpha subunit
VVAVLQNRRRAAVMEVGRAMLRTAYSRIANSCRDFSIAITNARARLVAQVVGNRGLKPTRSLA